MAALKYIAVGGLFAVIGMICGVLFARNFSRPPEPLLIDGKTIVPCGLAVLSTMFVGGLAGLVTGAGIGGCIAYYFPTPNQSRPTNT